MAGDDDRNGGPGDPRVRHVCMCVSCGNMVSAWVEADAGPLCPACAAAGAGGDDADDDPGDTDLWEPGVLWSDLGGEG